MHNFLSLFAVAENSAQFFNLVDGGWSSNSCMKLLEKKVRMVRHFILLSVLSLQRYSHLKSNLRFPVIQIVKRNTFFYPFFSRRLFQSFCNDLR